VDEERGIYGSEVMDIFGALADISSDTLQILGDLAWRGRRGGRE